MKEKFIQASKLPVKEKIKIYNYLIAVYSADTGDVLKPLTSCGSCIRDFEQYKPFLEWLR